MPGLFGGSSARFDPDAMSDAVFARGFNEEVRSGEDPFVGLVHHGDRDAGGYDVVEADDVVGLVYGAVSNPGELTASTVRGILTRPDEVLPTLDGPFALACLDRKSGTVVLARDKLGTRALYYTDGGPLGFASELGPLLTGIASPTVDLQALSDLLLVNHVWGDKTLVEEVRAVRPASYVRFEDGERSVDRYWSFSFGSRSDDRYATETHGAYRNAVSAAASTIEDPIGLWLSGGLDSRILAGTLHDTGTDFRAYTYDRPLGIDNDPFRTDIELATEVTGALGVDHEVLAHEPGDILDRIPTLVEVTDGAVSWNTLINISPVFDVDPDDAGVMMEGTPPIVCGEKVAAHHLGGSAHPADVLCDLHSRVDPRLVRDALAVDVEPKDTFIDEVRAAPHAGRDETVLGVTHLNYNSGKHFVGSNKVARAHVGTREPVPHGELLDLLGKFPPELRTQPIPFTGGRVPHIPSKMKLALIRKLDGDLVEIPYEMTQLPPSTRHELHGLGFVFKHAIQQTLSDSTLERWYREVTPFGEFVDELLVSASEREFFDADTLFDVRADHLRGDADRMEFISHVTTAELFLQTVLER